MFLSRIFGFFLCSVPKPPTRNKPVFSLVILVRFWLSWTWKNCSFVGMFDSCCAQRSQNKKAFPLMGWWLDGICLSVPTSRRQRLQSPPLPQNSTNLIDFIYLSGGCGYFISFYSSPFIPSHCFHLNFFYGFISTWNPASRMRQHSSSDPSSAGAQGLLCMPYLRQSCL